MSNSNSISRHTHHALTTFRRPQILLLTLPIFLLSIWLGNVDAFTSSTTISSTANEVSRTFNKGKRAVQLPDGDWTFSARPSLNPAYESAPVRVVSVTTETTNGPEISRVFVRNKSSKTISAVKLAWRLINQQSPTVILGQEQTTLITLRGKLAEGERKGINFSIPLFSFAEISKTLAKGGFLTGEFLVEIAAHEALYEDKETWKIASVYKNNNTASSLAFMKASFSFPGHRTDAKLPALISIAQTVRQVAQQHYVARTLLVAHPTDCSPWLRH